MTILLVDDNQTLCQYLASYLENKLHVKVLTAHNLVQCEQYLEKSEEDIRLIIAHRTLVDSNFEHWTRDHMHLIRSRRIKIIIYSGAIESPGPRNGLTKDIDVQYVSKHLIPDGLIRIIQDLLASENSMGDSNEQ